MFPFWWPPCLPPHLARNHLLIMAYCVPGRPQSKPQCLFLTHSFNPQVENTCSCTFVTCAGKSHPGFNSRAGCISVVEKRSYICMVCSSSSFSRKDNWYVSAHYHKLSIKGTLRSIRKALWQPVTSVRSSCCICLHSSVVRAANHWYTICQSQAVSRPKEKMPLMWNQIVTYLVAPELTLEALKKA